MDNDLVIDICKKKNVKKLKLFIKEEWNSNHILVYNNDVFNWYYSNNDDTYNFVIALQKNKVQGILGFIPNSRFDKSLTKNNTLWLALWKVKSSQEKNLLGLKLLYFLQNNFEFKCIAVNGININHPKMYRALGYRSDKLNHFIFFNNEHKQNIVLNYKKKKINTEKLELCDLNKKEITKINYNSFSSFFFNYKSDKSLLFIINKYISNKFYNYKVFFVSNNFYKSVFVLKLVSVNSYRALRIIDFIGDKEIFKYLHNTLNFWLQKFDAEYIDFLNYGIENEIILKSGLISKSNFNNLIVPNYFEPFVQKKNKLFFAFKTNQIQDIVICKGDGDQERPNQLTQKNLSLNEN